MAVVSTHRDMQHELEELRDALKQFPDAFHKLYVSRAREALKTTVMFGGADDADLNFLAERMERLEFKRGQLIAKRGTEMCDAYIIFSGEVRRSVVESGKMFIVSTFCPKSVGLLHFYNHTRESRYDAQCMTDVVAFRLRRKDMNTALELRPNLARSIIRDLSFYIRSNSKQTSTPLLEQRSYHVSVGATSVAAFVESFYRSFMNNYINILINKGETGPWFPDMQYQIPARMIYLNGVKQIRSYLDSYDLSENPYAQYYRFMFAFVPGVVMCPISSFLESAHANKNPEPRFVKWRRGYVPRLAREILFAMGMNQLADFFTERLTRTIDNPYLRGAMGSIAAGVASGYVSHVPHILSTRKQNAPHMRYSQIFGELWHESLTRVPEYIPEYGRPAAAKAMAVLFPLACLRRSLQISGTFIIINGITYGLRDKAWW